jgi:formylglycine-generating enzyme required for sulfatase activity
MLTRVIVVGMKRLPVVGGFIELADECAAEVESIKKDQQMKTLEERVKELEGAMKIGGEEARKIAEEVVAEERKKGAEISEEKEKAIMDIAEIMPASIKEKTERTMREVQRRGTSIVSALPIEASVSSESDRANFYRNLLPTRYPKYRKGETVPQRPAWEFKELVGMGGFGEVWRISHTELEMEQALKMCLEPNSALVLKREEKTLGALRKHLGNNENVVRIEDSNTKVDPYWIAMEYIEGGTLESWIRGFGGVVPMEEVVEMFVGICSGMKAAHENGIIHRDLKPGNILVANGRVPKITDFGLGKIVAEEAVRTSQRKSGQIVTLRGYGTRGYMSPEQADGQGADPADDVYAMGVILYQMIAGNPAKEPPRNLQKAMSMLKTKPRQEWTDLINECLYERSDRPKNAGEMMARVKEIEQGEQKQTTVPVPKQAPQKESKETELAQGKQTTQQKEKAEKVSEKVGVLSSIKSWWSPSTEARIKEEEEKKRKAEEEEREAEKEAKELKKRIEEEKKRIEKEAKEIEEREKERKKAAKAKKGNEDLARELEKIKKETASKTIVVAKGISGFEYTGTNKEGKKEYKHSKTGMVFVEIPGGTFQMGSTNWSFTQPIHSVTVPSFLIGKYQVTQAQWKAVMGTNPSYFKGDTLPVERVSWNDCKDFCKKTGLSLPSEAAWEYACRGGSTGNYCFGDSETQLGEYAWYYSNSSNQTHPVDTKKPNAYGLHNMHGNVWEWCEDNWHENYQGAPSNGSVWLNSSDSNRVSRGGSWFDDAEYCFSACRCRDDPGYAYRYLGFRCFFEARF